MSAAHTFGQALKAIRRAQGLSLQALARRAYCSPAAIGHLETGIRQPGDTIAAALDQALGADGLLADLAVTGEGDDMQRRRLLAALATVAGAGAAAPAAVAEQVRRQLEAAFAGGEAWEQTAEDHGRAFIADPLHEVTVALAGDLMLLAAAADEPGARRAAARMAIVYGAAQASLGAPIAARRWYRTGLRAADTTADPALLAWTRARWGYRLAYEGGTPAQVLDAGGMAIQMLRTPCGALAEAHAGRAHAAARLGDAPLAQLELDAARAALDRAPAQDPLSILSMPGWRLNLAASYVHTRLGNRAAAEDAATEARRSIPPEAVRWQAQLVMHEALSAVLAGDSEYGASRATGVLQAEPSRVVAALGREVLNAIPESARQRDAAAELTGVLA